MVTNHLTQTDFLFKQSIHPIKIFKVKVMPDVQKSMTNYNHLKITVLFESESLAYSLLLLVPMFSYFHIPRGDYKS